jgi:hypothetical protein
MAPGDPGAAAARQIEITLGMVEAGVEELRDAHLGDPLPLLAEAVFRAMLYESPHFCEGRSPPAPPRGCVCPPGAEGTCRGIGCPRQPVTQCAPAPSSLRG